MKPNLFIVGAPKSGTTFLYKKLKNHPELFFPKIKELNFFTYDELAKDSYYRDFKIKKLKRYLSFFKTKEECSYLVDASVSYFTFDKVPERIKGFNPEAKIIMIVRDPYKRAFSHYQMDKRMGYANKSFMEYLQDENSFHYRQYIGNSCYFEQFKRFEKEFGKDKILILHLENIKEDIGKLFTFLKISKIPIDFDKKVNENKISKNILGKFSQKNRNIIGYLKLIIPIKIINRFKPLIYKKSEKELIKKSDLNELRKVILKDYESFNKMIRSNS